MTDDSEPSPEYLSTLPSQPITDDTVKQIGESANPRIRGVMGFPGSTPTSIEAFLLAMESETHVIVFDPTAAQWRVYDSFGTEDMTHGELVDHASEIANEWFAESLSDRIAAAEESNPER